MKKLVALASMAVLLCASASFAKKALDEEEMDLVTAAGQPSIMDIEVITTGHGERTAVTETNAAIHASIGTNNTTTGENSAGVGDVDVTANVGGLDLDLPFDLPAALNVDYSDADIGSFDLNIGSGSVGSLTASAWASTTSTITGASATVTATHLDDGTTTLNVQSGSQTNLRAMVVNNIVGENQIASAMNIQTGAGGSDGEQANLITQSWGSSYDWDAVAGEIETVATAAAAGDVNNDQIHESATISLDGGGGGGGFAAAGAIFGPDDNTCILDDCHFVGAENHNGDGGDNENLTENGSTFGEVSDLHGGDGEVSTKIGILASLPLTMSADKMTRVRVDSEGDAFVDVEETDSSIVTLNVHAASQTDLAALFVNNIAGKNQIASATNITTHGTVAIGLDSGVNALVFDAPIDGTAAYAAIQINEINQYRGTPHKQFNPYGTHIE